MRKSIVAGAVLTGRVASVLDFGAFVDLGGGIQGLLHVSEMGWSRVTSPSEIVTPGDQITVKVLRVDEATGQDLARLEAAAGRSVGRWPRRPMPSASGDAGRVTRVADFGAFVELEPGVEGLAHMSTFAPTSGSRGWSKSSVPVGMTGTFQIMSIDPLQKRIGLSLVDEGVADATSADDDATPVTAPAPADRIDGRQAARRPRKK